MLTLGVHDGHTATAALFENGEIIAAISEERLNRKKEWNGFPELAIRKCLEITGKTVEQVDAVGFCSLMPQIGYASYLKPQGHKRLFSYASRILPERLLQSSKNVPRLQKLGGFLFKGRSASLKRTCWPWG
jgi:predicted NodU family carbamoyl transferase